jgi:hypothetical protein
VWSNDPAGVISELQEYKEDVRETNLSSPVQSQDPFAAAAALPEAGSDLPFDGPVDGDPFAGM